MLISMITQYTGICDIFKMKLGIININTRKNASIKEKYKGLRQ